MPSVQGVDDGVGYGVRGLSIANIGVYGDSLSDRGVYGRSPSGRGVYGKSISGDGVYGDSLDGRGVYGKSDSLDGVYGRSRSGDGVSGYSGSGRGVSGYSVDNVGVYAYSHNSDGVYAYSHNSDGVYAESGSTSGTGVHGSSTSGTGVFAYSTSGIGVYGGSSSFMGGPGYAAILDGRVLIRGPVKITGPLTKPAGSFKIDHPLDPANKYLSHSFVESPDMKNVYDGVVVLDDKGEAEIELPDWFGALNKDFRYQLTAIGAPAPNLHIAEEISDGVTTYYSNNSNNNENKNNSSRFKVAGGISGMKVSWQVTGIRKDPYANAHRIRVEEDKPAKERGYYTYPELYGQPEERGISRLLVPEIEKELLLINDKLT